MTTAPIELVCVGNDGGGYIKAQCRVGWIEVLVDDKKKLLDCKDTFIPMKNYRREDRINYCRYDIPQGVICYYNRSIQTNPRMEEEKWFRVEDGQLVILGDTVGGVFSFPELFLQEFLKKGYRYRMRNVPYEHHYDPEKVFT